MDRGPLLGKDYVISIGNGPQLPNHIKFGEFWRDGVRPMESLKSKLVFLVQLRRTKTWKTFDTWFNKKLKFETKGSPPIEITLFEYIGGQRPIKFRYYWISTY